MRAATVRPKCLCGLIEMLHQSTNAMPLVDRHAAEEFFSKASSPAEKPQPTERQLALHRPPTLNGGECLLFLWVRCLRIGQRKGLEPGSRGKQ
jgi:hypothetical protein